MSERVRELKSESVWVGESVSERERVCEQESV